MNIRADHKLKKNTVLRLSVGIPVYNEEKNIGNLISDILSQEESGFKILEIIIANDGSTDGTERIVNSFQDARIRLISNKKREGKPSRLNQIFRNFRGDALILHDGDVLLEGSGFYKKLIRGYLENLPSLVIAHAKALPGTTMIGRAIDNFYAARENMIEEFDYRKTIYGSRAGGFLLARRLAKKIKLAKNLLNDDTYIYLYCKLNGLKVQFQTDAIVWYRTAQTASDYRKQTIRYIRGGIQLRKIFGPNMLASEDSMPNTVSLNIMLYQFNRNILKYAVLKLNTLYSKLYVKLAGNKESSKWPSVASSKSLIEKRLGSLTILDKIDIRFDFNHGISIRKI